MNKDYKLKARQIETQLSLYTQQYIKQKADNCCMECGKSVYTKKSYYSPIEAKKEFKPDNIRLLCSLCYTEYHIDADMEFYIFESDFILEGNHGSLCVS